MKLQKQIKVKGTSISSNVTKKFVVFPFVIWSLIELMRWIFNESIQKKFLLFGL